MWLIYENKKITFTRVASEKEAVDQLVEYATMTICDRTDNNQQEVERFLNDVRVHKK